MNSYHQRLVKVREYLENHAYDALLVENPVDLLYLTGLELSTGKVVISKNAAMILVDGRYQEICSTQTLYPVAPLTPQIFKQWLSDHGIKLLAFDAQYTSYHQYTLLKDQLSEIENLKLSSTDNPLLSLRMIKDANELEHLRKSARLCVEGYHFLRSLLVEGIKECELAIELECFWKRKGGKKVAFDPIIAFGPNSSMPHYRAGSTPLKQGVPVLIDIGVVLNHYHSDMTRVVLFGEPLPEIKLIYSIVQEAKERALRLCKPGILVGELDQTARNYITECGYGDYFIHSLGHGVGLEIHEPPTIRSQGPMSQIALKPGMVITIEPGIYLPMIGGVRLEDTVVITTNGCEILTSD